MVGNLAVKVAVRCRPERTICIPGGLRRERDCGICAWPAGLAGHDRPVV